MLRPSPAGEAPAGTRFAWAARAFAGAAIVSATGAVLLAWWRPAAPATVPVRVVAVAAVGFAVGWVCTLLRVSRLLARGATTRRRVRRLWTRGPEPERLLSRFGWWRPLVFVTLLGPYLFAAAIALGYLAGDEPGAAEDLRRPVTGGALGLGALMAGFAVRMVHYDRADTLRSSWTPLGAVSWLAVYAVPAILSAPLLGWPGPPPDWTSLPAGLAALWLLVAPLARHQSVHHGGGGGGD